MTQRISVVGTGYVGLCTAVGFASDRSDGGRGWIGDVKNMLLNVSKLKSLG